MISFMIINYYGMCSMSCAITRIISSDAGHRELQNELNFVKIGSLEADLALKLGTFYCVTS